MPQQRPSKKRNTGARSDDDESIDQPASASPSKRVKHDAGSYSPKWHRKSPTHRLEHESDVDDSDSDESDLSIAASVSRHPRSPSPAVSCAACPGCSDEGHAHTKKKDGSSKPQEKKKSAKKKSTKKKSADDTASSSKSKKKILKVKKKASASVAPVIAPVIAPIASPPVIPMFADAAAAAAAYDAAMAAYNGVGPRPREDFFYNQVAAQSIIRGDDVVLDTHGNPLGAQYDLAREGIYNGFSIVIGQFYTDSWFDDKAIAQNVDALKAKGFSVRHTKSETECAGWLKQTGAGSPDVAWIISSGGMALPSLVQACKDFHARGKGLFLFGDNDPYHAHVNAILSDLFNGLKIGGNYGGQQQLKAGVAAAKGQFGTHLIFTGIENLFEGVTIAHPLKADPRFQVLATATDGNTCIQVFDPIPSQYNKSVASDSGRGRIAVDCAFTKLYMQWNTAGTARYIVNATCWLIGIERPDPLAKLATAAEAEDVPMAPADAEAAPAQVTTPVDGKEVPQAMEECHD